MELSEEGRDGVGQVVYCVGAAGGGEGFSTCSQPLCFTGKCIKTVKNF